MVLKSGLYPKYDEGILKLPVKRWTEIEI
jgi:hypothetical protein